MKILGNCDRGLVFVLSAPAGTGKTTLVRRLVDEFACVEASISCTTRNPRAGEVSGKDYFFVTREEFQEKVNRGEFLEYAEVFGQLYGTEKAEVEKTEKGHHVILVIDVQGAMRLQQIGIEAIYIFLAPPSMEALEQRLRVRPDAEDNKRRLKAAIGEMEQAKKYDYLIVNEEIEVAYSVLKSIFIAEEHKIRKNYEERLDQ